MPDEQPQFDQQDQQTHGDPYNASRDIIIHPRCNW